MSLTLSTSDLHRLNAALTTIVSPFEHGTPHSWGLAVLRAGQELLGADQGFVAGPLPDQPTLTVVGDANGAAAARAYWAYYHQVDGVLNARRRELGLEVYGRDMLYRPGELERDELHNDWVRPYRLHDQLGMSVSVPEDPAFPFLAHFYHEREEGCRFGERGLHLLGILLPAFKAAVHTVRQLFQRRDQLERFFDVLHDGVLVFDLSGKLVHRNAAVCRLLALEPEPERSRIQNEARHTAFVLGGLLRRSRKAGQSDHPIAPDRQIVTFTRRYHLAASLLHEPTFTNAPVVVVAVTPVAPGVVSDESLMQRFYLTRREVQVAHLLAAGKSNQEIATALHVSSHTVARHGEQVRRKLGVRSRAGVGAILRMEPIQG